jgi:hypothetical protein
MAIELRALSSASPVQPFSFNDLDEEVDTSSESSPGAYFAVPVDDCGHIDIRVDNDCDNTFGP